MEPTILENLSSESSISRTEVFGPVTCLYRVNNLDEALQLASDSDYGLTAAIHTQNLNRAFKFSHSLPSGVVNINGGTHGSEPHMPFGGVKNSGNGFREPGMEALNVYTENNYPIFEYYEKIYGFSNKIESFKNIIGIIYQRNNQVLIQNV